MIGGRLRAIWLRVWGWIKPFWTTVWRPSLHFSMGFLTLGGFIAASPSGAVSIPRWRRPTPRSSAPAATK